ncbi:putative inorganic phosphate transporter 1-9 [Silene latifolia]|uniref:putative inorganic phosphate transporter 1-9 n=1 Tax=Silene latifolia TaxID=37657 RepID=UPI003D781CF8
MGLRVLSVLDTTKVQYYHFKAIIIAGMGLFTDSYDLFCIAPVTILLGRIYYPHSKYLIPPVVISTMLGVALLGTIIGQLIFGRLGDLIGRRRVYGIALALMVLSSFGCGFSVCTSRTCVLVSFSFFRFILGIGIGGDYPLSATIMSEFANKTTRGAFIAAVFSMQGLGILFGSTVIMVVCAIFDRVTDASSDYTPKVADLAWRIILMIGAVPAAVTFYWRMMMPESARYTALVERNAVQAAKDMEKVIEVSMAQMMEETSSGTTPLILPPQTYPLFSKQFLQCHGRDLFSCAATWLIVDIIFYSTNLLQSHIYEFALPHPQDVNAFQEAYNVARFQAILAVCSTIPGYWVTVFLIDRIGRRKIQILGFTLMAVGLFAIGGPYDSFWGGNSKGVRIGFMIFYGLIFFFCNFGPNTTTFIVPAELFPARFRTTCHGISGAFGKVGAIIGSIGFLWASHKKNTDGYPKALGVENTLLILGVISLLGAAVTYFFTPETNGRSLEENEYEHDETANGNASVNVSA